MSPTFTSGKMKSMFPIIETISATMQKVMDPLAAQGAVIEIKDLAGRYTTDVIASCAYGIETNSLENPDSIFRIMGKKLFEPSWYTQLRNTLAFLVPDIARLLRVGTLLIYKFLGIFWLVVHVLLFLLDRASYQPDLKLIC